MNLVGLPTAAAAAAAATTLPGMQTLAVRTSSEHGPSCKKMGISMRNWPNRFRRDCITILNVMDSCSGKFFTIGGSTEKPFAAAPAVSNVNETGKCPVLVKLNFRFLVDPAMTFPKSHLVGGGGGREGEGGGGKKKKKQKKKKKNNNKNQEKVSISR